MCSTVLSTTVILLCLGGPRYCNYLHMNKKAEIEVKSFPKITQLPSSLLELESRLNLEPAFLTTKACCVNE